MYQGFDYVGVTNLAGTNKERTVHSSVDWQIIALGMFVWWKMLEMTTKDAFMNSFGGLFKIKMLFHTKAY